LFDGNFIHYFFKILKIACLSPADFHITENISTLNYATKAAYISNKPMINTDARTMKINKLKAEVSSLKGELTKAY